MSFSAKSFFSQKKGTIYSLALLIAVAVIVMGVLSVSGAKFSTSPAQQFSPRWVFGGAANASVNLTITNDASSPAAIKRVDITKPSGVSNIECGANVPTGWTCARGSGDVFVKFTNADGLAAGSSANFSINITPPAGAGNQSFTIDTFENTGGTLNINSTSVNTSVDANAPTVSLRNISLGSKNISSGDNFDSLATLFLGNGSAISIVVEVLDNGSGVGNVTLVYNYTNNDPNAAPTPVPYRSSGAEVGNLTIVMSNSSYGSGDIFNATFSAGTFLTNGTRLFFSIWANDTVGNLNRTNKSASYGFNFTIDSAAPRIHDVEILNFSQLLNNQGINSTQGINNTKTFGSTVEYIINSTLLLNVSSIVSDGGGSGVVRVEVMNGSGVFTNIGSIVTGSNGSASSSTWSITGMTITNFTRPDFNNDGVYNLTFRITDNTSNALITNFTMEVDDTPPTGSASTQNLTFAGKLSMGNVTTNASNPTDKSSNLTFIVRLETRSNINNVTRNVSVFGNLGRIFNLSFESGTASGTSVWNLSVGLYNTTVPANAYNLSEFCAMTDTDGSTCNLRFNFSDVLGRFNDTVNLTVAVDLLAPNVSIVSPVSLTRNYSATVLINVSVNDSVGPLSNVSFRIKNQSFVATTAEAPYSDTGIFNMSNANATNWIPMTLTSGANNQFSAQGYWTFTLNISGLNWSDSNYTIEINATDSGGRQNTTSNITKVIFDSSRPQNISIVAPATNSFHSANFTVGINATELISGLLNVSVRLENATHTSPWVGMNQVISALSSSTGGETVKYNASGFNLTHVGGQAMNMTDGNFTLRLNVTDTSGNQNTSVTFNLTIDTVLPGVSFIVPLNNFANNMTGNFTLNATVTESNVGTAQYRWVNDSSNAVGGRGPWSTMTKGTGSTFNSTFTNVSVVPALFDGNFSIELNVTDRAGNQNTSVYIQLLLDNNAPVIVATGSNTTNSLAKINLTTNFVVNLTINDNSTWAMPLGLINSTNINGTAFRLENSTFNGNWVSMDFATRVMSNANSNRTNASFTFSSVANGLYNIRFMVNDTAGNQNNTVQVNNVMLDNVAPGVVLTASNLSPAPSGGAGISGTLTINATVTDNLPVNISMDGNTSRQGNTFGVFYRFESASVTTAWLPMSTVSFQTTTAPHDRILFNASNSTTTLTDGDYTLRINATDSAGNQNTSVTVGITIQNGASSLQARNLTFFEGLWNGFANSSSGSYTFRVNTTANATCRYSLDTDLDTYNDMTSTMSNNVSREHTISFGSFRDAAAAGRTLYYACKDISGNFTKTGGERSTFTFGIDTRSRWNVTIPGKTDSKWPNYFQPAAGGSSNGWSSFVLATGALEQTTLSSPGTYNVTSVLDTLMSGTAAGNFTRIYAYTASSNSWETFLVGRTGNTFINFTNQTTYWINITAVERLEIN